MANGTRLPERRYMACKVIFKDKVFFKEDFVHMILDGLDLPDELVKNSEYLKTIGYFKGYKKGDPLGLRKPPSSDAGKAGQELKPNDNGKKEESPKANGRGTLEKESVLKAESTGGATKSPASAERISQLERQIEKNNEAKAVAQKSTDPSAKAEVERIDNETKDLVYEHFKLKAEEQQKAEAARKEKEKRTPEQEIIDSHKEIDRQIEKAQEAYDNAETERETYIKKNRDLPLDGDIVLEKLTKEKTEAEDRLSELKVEKDNLSPLPDKTEVVRNDKEKLTEAKTIAQEHGYEHPTKMLNSIAKPENGGERFETVQEAVKSENPQVQEFLDKKNVKKTVATTRAYEGEVREGVKKEIEKLGLTREVQNRGEAKANAKAFIEKVGEDHALEAVRNNDIADMEAAYVWNEIIEGNERKLSTETDPVKIAELEKRQAELFNEFSEKALSSGRFGSALADIYQNSDLGYNLARKIQEYKDVNKGEIPAEVEARFKEYDAKIKELNKQIAELESQPKEIIKPESREKKLRQSLSAEKIAEKKELAAKYRGTMNDVTRIVTLLGEKDFRRYAKLVLEEAAGDFKIWSTELINNVGDKIAEHLPKLYEELYGTVKSEQQKIARLQKQLDDLRSGKVADKIKRKEDSKEVTDLKEEIRAAKEELGLFQSKKLPDQPKSQLEKEVARLQKSIDEYKKKTEEVKSGNVPVKKATVEDTKLTRLKAEKLAVKEAYDKEIYKAEIQNRTARQKTISAIADAWGMTRILQATFDASFMLVQGLTMTMRNAVRNPKALGEAFKNTVKFFASESKTEQWLRNIKQQEWYSELKQSKLSLTEPHGKITAREELLYSDWANMIWNVIGSPLKLKKGDAYEKWKKASPFKAFERASLGYLDTLRVARWLEGKQMLEKKGIRYSDNPEAYKQMADVINTLTGRASLGRAEQISQPLTQIFFSPRNWASALKTATPYVFYHFGKMRSGEKGWKPTVAQKMAIADLSTQVALTTSMLMLVKAYLDGDDGPSIGVETDPRSSDFGKVKIGDKRIDPWGGKIQQIVFTSRMLSEATHDAFPSLSGGGMKTTKGGDIVPLGTPYKAKTMGGTAIQMVTNKLAPSASLLWEYMSTQEKDGKKVDDYGNEFIMSDEVKQRLYPMYAGTVADLAKDGIDSLEGFLLFYSFFGGGVQDYGKDKKSTHHRVKHELHNGK